MGIELCKNECVIQKKVKCVTIAAGIIYVIKAFDTVLIKGIAAN